MSDWRKLLHNKSIKIGILQVLQNLHFSYCFDILYRYKLVIVHEQGENANGFFLVNCEKKNKTQRIW